MARKPKLTAPETKKTPEIGEIKLNDLVYSIETKPLLHFMPRFMNYSILSVGHSINDPFPDLSFQVISEEIKKRLPALEKHQLEDIRTWLNDPLRKLEDLMAKEKAYMLANNDQMDRDETKKGEARLDEIQEYKNKIADLLNAIEKEKTSTSTAKTIQEGTRDKIKNIDIPDQDKNDHGDS